LRFGQQPHTTALFAGPCRIHDTPAFLDLKSNALNAYTGRHPHRRVIADAITSNRPRTRYTVGREAALLPLLAILPDRMLDRVLAAALRPHFPKESK
jgi:hypothetical protein